MLPAVEEPRPDSSEVNVMVHESLVILVDEVREEGER